MSDEPQMTALQWLINIHKVCCFTSIEKPGEIALNSELRRWVKQGVLEVNFQKIGPNDPWPPLIKSVVLFPSSKRKRCTLFFEEDVKLIQLDEEILNKVQDEFNEKRTLG